MDREALIMSERSERLEEVLRQIERNFNKGKRSNKVPPEEASWQTFKENIRKENFNQFYEWLELGIKKGWVTDSFCNTHEGDPYMTPEEEAEWDEGGDPCMVVLKVLI